LDNPTAMPLPTTLIGDLFADVRFIHGLLDNNSKSVH
jgi:hypothetical protein